MIRIRFFRAGRKKQPFYKIVVTNSKNAPSGGRFIEDVGFYDPMTKDCSVKEDRVKHWISEGASVSDTVYNLLVRKQVIIGKKRPVHSISKKEVPVEEKPKEEAVEEKPKEEVVEEKTEEVSEKKESVEETSDKVEAVEEKPKEEVVEEKN